MKNDESKVIIKFIVTLVIVLVVCVGIYFITKNVVNKDSDNNKNNESTETSEATISYDSAIVGTMLNKKDKEYYVILYDRSKDDSYKYTILVSDYNTKNKSLPLYMVDLSSAMNKTYYTTEKTNPTASNLSDLKFGDITVIKVKDGKITNAYETIDSIKTLWKLD